MAYALNNRAAKAECCVGYWDGSEPQIFRGEKNALFPNRFMIDPTGDWGADRGAVISKGLPKRLAFVLAGTADGPGAQHFAESEIAASMEMVLGRFPRLKERFSQAAGTMSGGEQQMLVIGRALMAKPKLLLLDEPSLGVAPKLVQDIARSIVAINRDEKVSVLLVEQNSRMALRISQRAYALTTGSVALSGNSVELLADVILRPAFPAAALPWFEITCAVPVLPETSWIGLPSGPLICAL